MLVCIACTHYYLYYEDTNPDIKFKHFHFTHNDVMSRSIGNKMLLADQARLNVFALICECEQYVYVYMDSWNRR